LRSRTRAHFVDGSYVADDEDLAAGARVAAALKRLGDTGEWIAGMLGNAGVPYAGLVEQVLASSDRPLDLLEGLVGRAEPLELAPRVLRRLCGRAPVVCIIDDAGPSPRR
jgi:hypothetical protein